MEHVELLREKGYEHVSPIPNCSSKNLFDNLLFELSKTYNRSLVDNAPKLFYLKSENTFQGSEDKLRIVFHYKYDPVATELSLSRLYVTLNKVSQEIELKTSHDLPTLSEVYDLARRIYLRHPQKIRDDFTRQWDTYIQLLRDKGYDETGLSNSKPAEQFIADLEQSFKNALFENIGFTTPIYFTTSNEGYFNNGTQEINFTFHYEFDPRPAKLQLRRLEATMGQKMILPIENQHDLPKSSIVYQLLSPKLQLFLENEAFLSTSLSKSINHK
jgi:hypothetical protein